MVQLVQLVVQVVQLVQVAQGDLEDQLVQANLVRRQVLLPAQVHRHPWHQVRCMATT